MHMQLCKVANNLNEIPQFTQASVSEAVLCHLRVSLVQFSVATDSMM